MDPRRAELARLQTRRTELQGQHATIEYRMARERDDALYAALSRQYQAVQADLAAVAEVDPPAGSRRRSTVESRSPEAQVEGALALLDDVARITADPAARAEINPLLKRLGLWIGLQFRPAVKGKKRVVQRLVSGRMVFGDVPLPVPLFGKDRVEDGPPGCGCGRREPAGEMPAMHDAIGGGEKSSSRTEAGPRFGG